MRKRDRITADACTYIGFPCLELSCELVKAIAVSRDQSDIVSGLSKETADVS